MGTTSISIRARGAPNFPTLVCDQVVPRGRRICGLALQGESSSAAAVPMIPSFESKKGGGVA
eukprot:3907169-Prorocentrum_lima.AAC.1